MGFADGLNVSKHLLNFPEPQVSDLDAGYLDFDPYNGTNRLRLMIDVPQDVKWNVYLYCTQPAFYSGQSEIPVQKLHWKLALQPNSGFRSVSMNKTLIMSGVGVYTIELDYRLLVDWYIQPGYYNIEIFYDLEILE